MLKSKPIKIPESKNAKGRQVQGTGAPPFFVSPPSSSFKEYLANYMGKTKTEVNVPVKTFTK